MPDGPRVLALPLRVNPDGTLATVAVGSAPELVQRATTICATRPGTVDGQPSFGVVDQTGRKGGPDVDLIANTLQATMPAVTALVTADRAGLDQALALAGVRLSSP